MKIDWNSKYTTIAVYTFNVACSIIIFFLAISHLNLLVDKIKNILYLINPFLIGGFIAYILNFLLTFYDQILFKSKLTSSIEINNKTKRILEILITYLTAALVIYLFSIIVLPELFHNIVKLTRNIPYYIDKSMTFINYLLNKLNIQDQYFNLIRNNINKLQSYTLNIIPHSIFTIGKIITDTAHSIWNLILGIIISFYLLADKERYCAITKKINYAVFPKFIAEKCINTVRITNGIFGKFLIGKIVDAFIIGLLTFAVLLIFRIPYSMLVAFIVGITNIIPFLGPIIGAVPSLFIVFLVSPIKALWFLIIIIIIHEIDGNIISPKILGESIGISPFWILFAILMGEKLLGLVGVIIGVPLFAVIYSLIKELIEDLLKGKNLPSDTEDYIL